MEQKYLAHYGVKGMRWGVRRKSKKQAPHEDYAKAHDKKKVKYMSNQELRDRNNRLNMEKQYRELTQKKSKGKSFVKAYIATAGTIAAVAAATTTYKKYGKQIIDKIGPTVIKKTPNAAKAKVAAVHLARDIAKFRPS